MRRISGKRTLALFMVSLSAALCLQVPTANASRASLGTITGAVLDNRGNPVSGAFISILRNGADRVVKETRSDAEGRFTTRISPGRYVIRAIAHGFNAVVFSSVEVRASQEVVYRFNLEPIGSGKTLPERRRDRDDVKWTLRSAQARRSIFQVQAGDDRDIQAALGIEEGRADSPEMGTDSALDSEKDSQRRMRGVVETYFAGNSFGPGYSGLNFAVSDSSTGVDLVLAGQTGVGPNAPQRLEASTHVRAGERHRLGLNLGAVTFGAPVWRTVRDNALAQSETGGVWPGRAAPVGQFSVRAIDEWIIHDGIVVVLGLDYSRFIGAGGARSVQPRVGVQFDANARTRLKAAYAPGGEENRIQSVAPFEGYQVAFTEANKRPIAYVDGRAVMERSHRLEFGIERVLDNESGVEASAFFDTTTGRGVGLLSTPISAFSDTTGEAFINVANQQGESRGMRLVYTRRLSRVWTASAGYSFGRGQRLAAEDISRPSEMFENGFFQTAAVQLDGGFDTGTNIQTVLRFSPNATVFAIDPFAGRLAVYDPSLSIQVTQELPSFGLPLRAEAVLDARNLLDLQANTENAETLTQLNTGRRSVRGGISLRF
ncbi:MAG TPA: carboxypeptidase-like regulatory domain-containing protein [Pyrinomonadaceae bacterium]|nr:carboxypeptidase-like regulatory domain-containing protein [Pyrinomonadaceae bacterium]